VPGFDTLLEADVLIERSLREYNTIRPRCPLGYRPPSVGADSEVVRSFGCTPVANRG
jgi:hypothetical protein